MRLSADPDYRTVVSYAGGRGPLYLESVAKGPISNALSLVRQMSILAGGMVVGLRNPVTAAYAAENAAVGGLAHAIEIGGYFYGKIGNPDQILDLIQKKLKAQIITSGPITEFSLNMTGGYDVGKVVVNEYELTYWNEYMTLERNGERLGTFPDLIVTLDAASGLPLTTAEIDKGMEIVVVNVPRSEIILGGGMFLPELFAEVEPIIQKEMVRYAFER